MGERTQGMPNHEGVVERPLTEEDSLPIELDSNFFALAEALHSLDSSLSEVELAKIVSSFKEPCYSKDKDEVNHQKTIDAAAKMIAFFDEATLVTYVKSRNFHRTVLERVLDKWSADEAAESSVVFKKLVRVMVELGILKYNTDVRITEDLTAAESSGILKETEKFISTHSVQEVIDSVKTGEIHLSVINKLNEGIKKKELDIPQGLVDKITEITAGLYETQKAEDERMVKRLREVAAIIEESSKDEIFIMLASARLNPYEIIELSEKINSGSFPGHPNLNFAMNEIRSELPFYRSLYKAELALQKAGDFKEVTSLIGSKKTQLKAETLKILLDLYKAEMRPSINGSKEKIEAILEIYK